MRHLMAVFLVLGMSGCSLSNDSDFARVTIQVPAPGPRLASPLEAMFMSTPPPATSDGFRCLAVNVIGPGIAQAFGNSSNSKNFDNLFNRVNYCTYPGITALLKNPAAGAATINVNLKVPSGPKRLIQMLGIADPLDEICDNGVLDSRADNTQQSKPFEIGRVATDLFHDAHVSITEDWNALSAAEQTSRGGDCKTPLEIYANAVRAETALVAYWPFAETGGTTAQNQRGSMGDMALTNATLGAAVGPVAESTAMHLNATGFAGVNVGHTFSSATFMVEMWVKIASGTCVGGSALFQMASAGFEKIEIFCDASGFLNVFVSDSSGGSNSINVGSEVADGQWHYLAAGKDASDYLKLYMDGNHMGDSPSNVWISNSFPFTSSGRTWIGFDQVNTGLQPGDYANVAIYDQALTSAQVTAHYNAAGYTAPPALIAPLR